MKYAGFALICVLFGSCLNDGNCLITATNNMHLQFKTKRDNKTDTAILLRHIFISGSPDTVLIKNDTLVSDFLIPVDIHRAITTFVFQRADSLNSMDTLQVSYTAQSKVIAKDCGAFTYYQNLNVLYTNLKLKVFSTSLLTDPTLGNTSSAYAVNYQIFY